MLVKCLFVGRSAVMNKVTIKKLLTMLLWFVALYLAANSKHKLQLYYKPLMEDS
jgi:Mn2+/Fe2+ NRAMP family transporter